MDAVLDASHECYRSGDNKVRAKCSGTAAARTFVVTARQPPLSSIVCPLAQRGHKCSSSYNSGIPTSCIMVCCIACFGGHERKIFSQPYCSLFLPKRMIHG